MSRPGIGGGCSINSLPGWACFLTVSGDSARYPGARAAACEQERTTTGIPLPPGVITELRVVSAELGPAFPEPVA